MANPVLSSTLLLTGLLTVGLIFFIRASTKDRIQTAQFSSQQSPADLYQTVAHHLQSRAYHLKADATSESETVTLVGLVRPSIFLAVFLTGLAAIGWLCIALVLSTLFTEWRGLFWGLLALSPLAGIFYWRKSARPEEISFRVSPANDIDPAKASLIVKGHRDEIAQLQAALPLTEQDRLS